MTPAAAVTFVLFSACSAELTERAEILVRFGLIGFRSMLLSLVERSVNVVRLIGCLARLVRMLAEDISGAFASFCIFSSLSRFGGKRPTPSAAASVMLEFSSHSDADASTPAFSPSTDCFSSDSSDDETILGLRLDEHSGLTISLLSVLSVAELLLEPLSDDNRLVNWRVILP